MTPPGMPAPGDAIDGFTVGERIHAGGMGAIFRVTGPDPGFPMIMKVPHLGPGEPSIGLVSFEVEAMVLPALRGPHVPRFVAAGDLARRPYLVMEEVEGRSLKEWTGRGPLALSEVVRLGAAVATAAHQLHVQDAIHLDLKPSNVIIRPSGEAVLIDFGLAHHAHYPDLVTEEHRRPIGSAPYLSPEQVFGVRNDPRSDVFAIGVILYELATGRLPFGSPGRGGLRKRLYRDPEPPCAIVPGVPEWLQEVILRALEPDADRRHASAAQVAFDLQNPDQVQVGERGQRRFRASALKVAYRWIQAAGFEPAQSPRPSARVAGGSIVMVAIATSHHDAAQLDALREAVRRLLETGDEVRLAVVEVVRPAPELGGSGPDDTATSQRVKHLVLLRDWAEPLRLPATRVSFHVLESGDPTGALLDYARVNAVEHVVVGAPPRDFPLKGLLGTVSTKVAAEAPCTVTIVRPRTRA